MSEASELFKEWVYVYIWEIIEMNFRGCTRLKYVWAVLWLVVMKVFPTTEL